MIDVPYRTPMVEDSRTVSAPWERALRAAFESIPRETLTRLQSELVALAGNLKRSDVGLLVWVSDFAHTLEWNGTGWQFAPGDGPGGYIQAFAVDPDPADGWRLCDGSATTYLKKDGTTGSYTTLDLVSAANKAAYPKLGGTVSGPNAAVAPTHTDPSVNSASTGASVNPATTGAPSATATVQSGAGATVASSSHSHNVTATLNDPGHSHTLTAGSVGSDGEPCNIVLRPWFRR